MNTLSHPQSDHRASSTWKDPAGKQQQASRYRPEEDHYHRSTTGDSEEDLPEHNTILQNTFTTKENHPNTQKANHYNP